jgi:hypothetical protein
MPTLAMAGPTLRQAQHEALILSLLTLSAARQRASKGEG